MLTTPSSRIVARCSCGKVEIEAHGKPIMSTICYCESCQEGSRRIEDLPNGSSTSGPDGGTAYVIYRKDRVGATGGSEFLLDVRLTDGAPTRRVVAGCCGSPMFLDFEKGHWLSVYRSALGEEAPPTQMRTQTRSKPDGVKLPDGVPSYPGYPLGFVARLLCARLAMLLGR